MMATPTTAISVACPRCGSIGKSGRSSCCGRGGSWFRNCGSAGNMKLQHTWRAGIQACEARPQESKAVPSRHQGVGAPSVAAMASYNGAEAALTAANTSTLMSFLSSSPAYVLMAHHTPGSTSIITQESTFFLALVFTVSLIN